MKLKVAIFGLILALIVVGGPTAVDAAPPKISEKFKFDAASKYGLIVVYVKPQRVVPDYSIAINKFSLADRKWDYGPLKGWTNYGKIRGLQSGFLMSAVDPAGTYAINQITTQGFWGGCFNGGTKAFEVKPVQVTFIGVLDPEATLTEVTQAVQAGTLPAKTGGTLHFVWDAPRPALAPPPEVPDWQDKLAAHLKAYPGITAPLVAAELVDATFQPGRSIQKVCERY
jgi:hypothetical protein